LKGPDKIRCAKCGKNHYETMMRQCIMPGARTCLDCCMRCMFQNGSTGQCDYKEGKEQ